MLDFLKDNLGSLLPLLAGLLPLVGYLSSRRKVAALTASNEALRKDAERVAAKQAARQAAAKLAAETKAKAAAEAKAATVAIEEKAAMVEQVAAKKGKAKAASAYVKAMKKGGTMLLILAYLGYSTQDAHAADCAEGVSLKTGEVIACDAECLPADELDFLVKRSIACEKLEVEHKSVLRVHHAEVIKLGDQLALCDAHTEDLQEDLAALTGKVAEPETSVSTYFLIGIGLFVTGIAIGGAAVYQLER
jgi:nucleoid-associated protein YgaU